MAIFNFGYENRGDKDYIEVLLYGRIPKKRVFINLGDPQNEFCIKRQQNEFGRKKGSKMTEERKAGCKI